MPLAKPFRVHGRNRRRVGREGPNRHLIPTRRSNQTPSAQITFSRFALSNLAPLRSVFVRSALRRFTKLKSVLLSLGSLSRNLVRFNSADLSATDKIVLPLKLGTYILADRAFCGWKLGRCSLFRRNIGRVPQTCFPEIATFPDAPVRSLFGGSYRRDPQSWQGLHQTGRKWSLP
jgi:hypothetical protein